MIDIYECHHEMMSPMHMYIQNMLSRDEFRKYIVERQLIKMICNEYEILGRWGIPFNDEMLEYRLRMAYANGRLSRFFFGAIMYTAKKYIVTSFDMDAAISKVAKWLTIDYKGIGINLQNDFDLIIEHEMAVEMFGYDHLCNDYVFKFSEYIRDILIDPNTEHSVNCRNLLSIYLDMMHSKANQIRIQKKGKSNNDK